MAKGLVECCLPFVCLDFSWLINWKGHPVWMDSSMRWCEVAVVWNCIVSMVLTLNRWFTMGHWRHVLMLTKRWKRSTTMPSKHRGSRWRLEMAVVRTLVSHHFSYPLILCFELQCNTSQQDRLAQLLIEIFGDKLSLDHLLPESNIFSTEYRALPSPNDLRGKIIVKVERRCPMISIDPETNRDVAIFLFQGKKLPPSFSHEIHQDYGEITDDEDCYEDNKRRSKKVSVITASLRADLLRIRISSANVRESLRELSPISSPYFVRRLSKILPLHSTSVSEGKRSLHHRWNLSEQSGQVCTFSENAGLRLATSDAEEFVNYNKRFISRISPGTWRVDSSNLNPQDFWNVGCQMGKSSSVSLFEHDDCWRTANWDLLHHPLDLCRKFVEISRWIRAFAESLQSLVFAWGFLLIWTRETEKQTHERNGGAIVSWISLLLQRHAHRVI